MPKAPKIASNSSKNQQKRWHCCFLLRIPPPWRWLLLLFGLCLVAILVTGLAFWLLTNPHMFPTTPPYRSEDKKVPGKLSGWMFVAIAFSCGLATWAILHWLERSDKSKNKK
ncbi:hypothetical protein [Geitlerinema sp. PCC 9228]|jgi:hypothetical protein|uniref:hypothetical protein n=1 Tax=Geitlerinema sp. PCC 9228 TaxID=111611 RepID=UPI0008F9A6E3|nr:hypothetical protein [Geitlerinema sp. PCC 9228]